MTLNSEQISQLVERMEKEVKNIKREILKICWYMRGGLNYEEAMNLGFQERDIISGIINENLETTKKTQMPFF